MLTYFFLLIFLIMFGGNIWFLINKFRGPREHNSVALDNV